MKILISGASSGIGEKTAQKCLEKGFEVVGLARDFTKCMIKHPLFSSYSIDLSDLNSLPQKLKEIVSLHPDVDSVVLSAGRGLFGYLEQLSHSDVQSLMDLNFTSAVFLTKAFLPLMKQKKKGSLIFIGSEAALQGKTQGSIYCASKFALRGFSQALRKECAKGGVSVCLINPGMVKTPFFDPLHFCHGEREENYCTPEEVAEVILNQITARKSLVFDEINLSPIKHQIVPN